MSSPAGPHTRRRPAPTSGEPTVLVADRQSAVAVDVGHLVALAASVLGAEDVAGAAELSLSFVDEATMADSNARFLGGDGPTDVLAFPIDLREADGAGPGLPRLLGDVVVCPAVAERQAGERGGDLDDELALLVVHGILHVLGRDHAEPEEAAAMQARERELLARFHHGVPR